MLAVVGQRPTKRKKIAQKIVLRTFFNFFILINLSVQQMRIRLHMFMIPAKLPDFTAYGNEYLEWLSGVSAFLNS